MPAIGPIQLAHPLCQAGLAGYSDRAMRLVARRRGCPYAVTEALLDVILVNGGEGLRKSIDINDEGTLVFNRSDATTVNPTTTGTGTVRFTGSGTVTHTGNIGTAIVQVSGTGQVTNAGTINAPNSLVVDPVSSLVNHSPLTVGNFANINGEFVMDQPTTFNVGTDLNVGDRVMGPSALKISDGTVNAATPAVSVGAALRRGPLAFGVGADVQYALGEWHSVPTGDTDTRSFTWVHADAGTEWLRLSAGPLFPWHVGVGVQARVPVWKGLGPAAAVAYGVPLPLTKTDGTAFDASPTWSAWGGVGYTLR